jgi:hypothetical protein
MDHVTFHAAEDCVVCPFGDGVAVLDLRTNIYFTLNAVAAVVWAKLESGACLDGLVAAVVDDFDVSAEICSPDVQSLLADMSRAGLVAKR